MPPEDQNYRNWEHDRIVGYHPPACTCVRCVEIARRARRNQNPLLSARQAQPPPESAPQTAIAIRKHKRGGGVAGKIVGAAVLAGMIAGIIVLAIFV